MKKKILSFIFDGKNFLALRNNPNPNHGGDFWFVVTGGVEGNETFGEAAKREVKEETNLDAGDIIDLNWGSLYKWHGMDCEEHNFILFSKPGKIKLNEEHKEFRWLEIDEFIKLIRWYGSKDILRKVLERAMKKQVYFKEIKLENDR